MWEEAERRGIQCESDEAEPDEAPQDCDATSAMSELASEVDASEAMSVAGSIASMREHMQRPRGRKAHEAWWREMEGERQREEGSAVMGLAQLEALRSREEQLPGRMP